MEQRFRNIFCLSLVISGLIFAPVTYAQKNDVTKSIQDQIKASGKSSGLAAADGSAIDPRLAAASIIQLLLQVLGIIFVALIFTAGFWLVTAKGEESKIEKAHTTMQAAVIGLIIIMMSYSITWFVGNKIREGIESKNYYQPEEPPFLGL